MTPATRLNSRKSPCRLRPQVLTARLFVILLSVAVFTSAVLAVAEARSSFPFPKAQTETEIVADAKLVLLICDTTHGTVDPTHLRIDLQSHTITRFNGTEPAGTYAAKISDVSVSWNEPIEPHGHYSWTLDRGTGQLRIKEVNPTEYQNAIDAGVDPSELRDSFEYCKVEQPVF